MFYSIKLELYNEKLLKYIMNFEYTMELNYNSLNRLIQHV